MSYASVGGTVVFIVCLIIGFFIRVKDIDVDDIGWFFTNDTGDTMI